MLDCSPAALKRLPDGAQQRVGLERLGQKLDSSRLHGRNRRRNVAIAGNEDDRHVRAVNGNALLQIEAIEAWKTNVENQTAGDRDTWARQEFLCGLECLRLPAGKEMSSSTTNTIGVSRDIDDNLASSAPSRPTNVIVLSSVPGVQEGGTPSTASEKQ